jgi:hypothetical protein
MKARAFAVRFCLTVPLLAGFSAPAAAQGLFLKLSTEEAKVAVDRPVKIKLTAVVTRSFDIPAPEFFVDDGSGRTALPEAKVRPLDEARPGRVSPGTPRRVSWELELPSPGRYRIQAVCRLSDRVVESNKLAVEVLTSKAVAENP